MQVSSNRIYHFRGTPKEIGLAMGRALGERLEHNIRRYMSRRPPRPDAVDMDKLRTGALPWLRSLPTRFQEEFEGLADGANLPLQRLAEWAYIEQCVQEESCSGFVCSLTGQVWVGRNNDMPVPDMWGYLSIREVAGRIPTMCFSLEGDVFAPTGYNRDKLWLHCHYLPVSETPRAGRPHLPSYVLLTEALETCSTLREVEALLDRVDRDDGMLLFAVDGKTAEFAIFECASSDYAKRLPEGPWLIGTNHAITRETKGPSADSVARYCRMEELVSALWAKDSLKTPTNLIAILADDGVEKRHANYGTVYANVACPGSGEIWYTLGGYPAASHGHWQRVVVPWEQG